MRSTMMSAPLLVSRLLEHGSTVHGTADIATWTGAGSRRKSYAQVGTEAARLAHALRDELGVTGDQRVATVMWNNAEHLIAYFAVPSMGAVLHTLNPRLFPDQLIYIANHAGDRVILVDDTLVPLLAAVLPSLKTVEHVVVNGSTSGVPEGPWQVHSWETLLAGRPTTFEWPDLDENDAAALCYTSGTTGNPRGVAYSHRSIWLHSMQICTPEGFGLTSRDRYLAIVPMFHAMSWGLPYAAFMSGASLIMPDRFMAGAAIAPMIATERPTKAAAVPTIWTDLLTFLDANETDTSSLSEVIVGGSACPPALMHAFQERYGIQIVHAWGMTEMSPLGSVSRPPAGVTGDDEWAYRYSQGRVPAGVAARIVGPLGEVMPADGESVGELEVRGPWVTAGYFSDDETDPDKFRGGWLRTGDVGTLSADGFLRLTDRAKDVIKSGGEWISSVELENLLMAHPAVLEACVVGVPDDRWGERPFATVVLREGATAEAAQLRDFLSERVAKWQLPERWAFIPAVPKTSVGKFDKKQVRSSYATGSLTVLEID
ncbi:fatty acid--CoA ligase [Catenuloplanes sp. NPDC051500]|uniref:fatty acid--CoA ligase n=1 Tax=Catenuloplanes sp. NPDC051500 TaxID=3363959 RepID=UPI0037BB9253